MERIRWRDQGGVLARRLRFIFNCTGLPNGAMPVKIRHVFRRRYKALVRFWNFHIRGRAPKRPFRGAFVHLPDGGLLWCPPIKKEPGPGPGPDQAP